MRNVALPLIAAGLLSIAAVAQSTRTPQPSDLVKDYKKLTSVVRDHLVDPGLAMLCRGASREEVQAAEKVNGPHAFASVSIYVDARAEKALKDKAKSFSVGAVIIKEKHAISILWPKKEVRRNGVTGMIKRAPGYDPKNGDWEYFIKEEGDKPLETGKIATCIACHAKAPGPDHLFATWWKPKGNEKKSEKPKPNR